jgi:ketosteroid isomerase-like protein
MNGEAQDPPLGGSSEDDFQQFLVRCGEAVAHQVGGESGPFLALWSRGDDVAILGALGSCVRGWERVRAHLLGASRRLDWSTWAGETMASQVSGDLAYSVGLERMTRPNEEPKERTLRVTQIYRREQGEWRVILRHANVVTADDERNEELLAGHD